MLHELKQIGLSDKEAKVYLASLELGKASVQDIAKKASVNRTTTYIMIESLIKRSLLYTTKTGKRLNYIAENPEKILELIRLRKKEFEENEHDIISILPELKSIYNLGPEKPRIRFFEGKEVAKAIFEDVLTSKPSTVDQIYSADYLRDVLPKEEAEANHEKMLAENIKQRALYTRKDGPFSNVFENIQERFLPQEQFPVSADIIIYGNKIAMIALRGKLIGVIIESEEISYTMQTLFNLAWETAEQFQNNT